MDDRTSPVLLTLVAFTLAGCSEPPLSGAEARRAVTFVVTGDAQMFAAGAELGVSLWSADQLETLERNARCSVSHDPSTGADVVRCPEGVTYEEVVPEQTSAPVGVASARVELASRRVHVGERYRIAASGRSADGCNTTSARHSGTADGEVVVLDHLEWETTLRACATG